MFVIHTKNQPLDIFRLVAISKIIRSYPILQYLLIRGHPQTVRENSHLGYFILIRI